MTRKERFISAVLAVTGSITSAFGQCAPQWSGYPGPQLDNGVRCVTVWDPDGAGPIPSVVVAGGNLQSAGSTHLGFVGAWNGLAWQPMGAGVDGTVESSTVFDPDGPGPLGPEPVIGGDFGHSATTAVSRISTFHAGQWVPLGIGLSSPSISFVNTLAVHGPDLVAGGQFDFASGIPVQGLALWNGSTWRAFPDEHAAGPRVFANLGGTLYAGGLFLIPPGPPLASVLRWDDPAWVAPAQSQHNNEVWAFALFRGRVIAAGGFTSPGNHITAFSGGSWQPLGQGLNGPVNALCVFDPDGPGPLPELLIAGGNFNTAGGQPASGIAAWDGTTWSALGAGTTGQVRALTVWNNQLVVAGDFYAAGGVISPGMAFWGCPQTPCSANCDHSAIPPILNVNDFMCFLNQFAAADPAANCDGSTSPPILNVNDFQCFINQFAAGCS